MSRQNIANIFLYASIFALPWQTRWIFRDLTLGSDIWEYGRLSIYLVEVLIFIAFALRGQFQLQPTLEKFGKEAMFFLSVLMISVAWSQNISLALGTIIHILAAIALFFLMIDRRTSLLHVGLAFVSSLILPSIFAWYQVLTGLSPANSGLGLAAHDAATLGASVVETASGRLLRAYGTFPHPNIFGGYLAIGLLVCGWHGWYSNTNGTKVPKNRFLGTLVPFVSVAVLSSTLVLTFSRSAWLAFAVGVLVWISSFVIARRHQPTKQSSISTDSREIATLPQIARNDRIVYWFLITITVTVLATVTLFHQAIFSRFQPSNRLESISISERTSGYRDWDDVIRQNIFTGVGPGNYTLALATVFPGRPTYAYQPIHNTILLFLAETGILGLVVLVRFFRLIFERKITSITLITSITFLSTLFILLLLDHYFFSLWPGLILLAFTFAFFLKSLSGSKKVCPALRAGRPL